MGLVYIGKVVSTHGIKGEIRIISDFLYKEKAFKPFSFIVVNGEKFQINHYRKHKNYDMIMLDGFSSIDDVSCLLNRDVYKEQDDLCLAENEVLDDDLLEYVVIDNNQNRGVVKEVFFASPTNKILRVEIANREVLIPFASPFLEKIDYKNHQIIITMIDGM